MLSNETVSLRAVEPSDLDMLYMLENDTDAAECSFGTAPLSRHMLWQYIENYSADIHAGGEIRFIIVENASGQSVGTIDISDYNTRDRHGFVGIAILPESRRRGLGYAALKLLCSYASETVGAHSLAAQVAADNEASRRMFAKAGFHTCGSLRSWIRRGKHYADVLLYQILFP